MNTLATVESLLGSVFFALLLGCAGVVAGAVLTLYAQRRGWVRPPQ